MQTINPCLWFDTQAEEAMNFYISVFKNSKVLSISRYGDAGPGEKGTVLVTKFALNGQEFTALNGGPQFKFTEAISLVVNCKTQEEIDHYWVKLSEGGYEDMCGWIKDKYGLSWQIVPEVLDKLVSGDLVKSNRVMEALLKMRKLDVKTLQQAYDRE